MINPTELETLEGNFSLTINYKFDCEPELDNIQKTDKVLDLINECEKELEKIIGIQRITNG